MCKPPPEIYIRLSVNAAAPTRIFHRRDWSMNWENSWMNSGIYRGLVSAGALTNSPRQAEARDKTWSTNAWRNSNKELISGEILTKRRQSRARGSLRRISGKMVRPRANRQRLPMSKRQSQGLARSSMICPPSPDESETIIVRVWWMTAWMWQLRLDDKNISFQIMFRCT